MLIRLADIELLTSYVTSGYENGAVLPGTPFYHYIIRLHFIDIVLTGLQLTDQPLVPGTASTYSAVPYGFDPTADFHE